ncbi:apoptosis-antagonizing transcription factor [Armillaria mellea]|nr:apoptosis-antagonizing transcription factor [Armillaria mellea]
MATSRLSLSQQIAQLEAYRPRYFDPEDIQPAVDDDDVQDINPAAREHYVDVGPSSLRLQQNSVLDPKYDSVRTSRKQLMEGSSESEDDEGGEEEENSAQSDEADEDEIENEESPKHRQKTSSSGSDNQRHVDQDDLSSSLKRSREQDRKKGAAVAQQLSIWNSLLNGRIRLHKSGHRRQQTPTGNPSEEGSVGDQSSRLVSVDSLCGTHDSISLPPRKRRRLSSDDSFQEYHQHTLQVLSKWSSKIQAVAPSVLLPSNRNTFSKNSDNSKTVVQCSRGTRIWRGKAERLGRVLENEEEQEHDSEIFDDTDLYQQLLRDVIDAEKNGADDWLVVQKQKKAKKKVDTKASKGRKIRYEVHEKLQNFMVPVTINGGWHEQQIDELFGSLLGVGFENALDHHGGGNGGIGLQNGSDGISTSGFRVFG